MNCAWALLPTSLAGIYIALLYTTRTNLDPLSIAAFLLLSLLCWKTRWEPSNRLKHIAFFSCMLIFLRFSLVARAESYAASVYSLIVSLYVAAFTPWSLQQYSTCLASLLILIAVPWRLVDETILAPTIGPFLSHLTASVISGIYRYLSFTSYADGQWVRLPTGSLLVYYGCTFAPLLLELFRVTLLFRGGAWLNGAQKRWSLIVTTTILLAVFLSIVRVTLLAWLVASPNLYQIVHGPMGSAFFSAFAAIILASILLKPYRIQCKN